MHPSSLNIYGNTSFSTSYQQQRKTSFFNYNHENHSKPSQSHCHHHYIPLEDRQIVPEHFQQLPFTNDHNCHATAIAAHENSNPKTTNMQSTMDKSSNENGAEDCGDRFNSRVIFENNCLKAKRSSKKDRHSKINTARGPRDRRMRLSLDVAKKFFRLQDLLGFDKASNTIEWLLVKSKPAIRDLLPQQLNRSCSLLGASNSPSSASECEVLSGMDDQSAEKAKDQDEVIVIDKEKFPSCSSNKDKKKLDTGVRKSVYIHHPLAKETREKARARARKRTTEKRNIKLGCLSAGYDQYSKLRTSLDQVIYQNTKRIGSWIPFGEHQVHTTDHTEYPSSNFQFKQGIVGDTSSMMSSNWSPSFFLNYQHTPGPSHEHQFNDFQILAKPWEGDYN